MATEAQLQPNRRILLAVPPSSRFANRELSWLDFNARVLALAEDNVRPLLERVRFLAIFSNNLDEFFQIRVAGLKEQLSVGLATTSPDGMTRANSSTRSAARPAADEAAAPDLGEERPAAPGAAGISVVDWEDLGGDDRVHLRQTFEKRVFPILTPLSVDPAHPFPYISDLSLNLAVVARDPSTQIRRFARVKVPPNIPRLLPLPDGERFIPQEQVIAANLDMLFPGMEIVAVHPFRVTRDLRPRPGDRRGRRPPGRDRVDPAAARALPEAVRLEVHGSMPKARPAADRGGAPRRTVRRLRDQVDARHDRSGRADQARPSGPQVRAVDRRHAATAAAGGERQARHLQRDRRGRRARPPPVRRRSPPRSSSSSRRPPATRSVLAIKQTLYRTSGEDSRDRARAGPRRRVRQADRGAWSS